ncbi:hypothetical protein H5410_026393 [Solanum commersonii]|uniref:Uncharacterized protein n=1 Tax=Solanum commersonii TaxID=4109 RepID=A0A9J5YYH6_SOLCO|nr:hypothetical protein H5410_026393 [Solanum commersonii]
MLVLLKTLVGADVLLMLLCCCVVCICCLPKDFVIQSLVDSGCLSFDILEIPWGCTFSPFLLCACSSVSVLSY